MRYWLLLVFVVYGAFSFSQLSGKYARFGLDNVFCGEFIYFLNDSLAVTTSGCEARQFIAFYSYRMDAENKLVFRYIPKNEMNPVKAIYKANRPAINASSIGLVDLCLKYTGDSLKASKFTTDLDWNLMNDSLCVTSGRTFGNLTFSHLLGTGLCVRFPELEVLSSHTICFHPAEFSGTGDLYVVDLIFPLFFLHYQLFYDESDSSFMDFSYKNGELYYFFRGKYELCELESFN